MLPSIVPNLKAIHQLFSTVLALAYSNERKLFDEVLTPIRGQAAFFYEEYLAMFEALRTHPMQGTVDEADQLISILVSFQKDKYSFRRDFFEFLEALHSRMRQRVRSSKFLNHAEGFLSQSLEMLLGHANQQERIGSHYTELIAYVRHFKDNMMPDEVKEEFDRQLDEMFSSSLSKNEIEELRMDFNAIEAAWNSSESKEKYARKLVGYCDWNIKQMKWRKSLADRHYFGCKAALIRL